MWMLWLTENKKIVTYIIVILVIAAILYYFYYKGKKDAGVEQAELPDDYNGALNETERKFVRELTEKIYKDVDSWGLSDDDLFQELAALSSKLFVAVYNDYNDLYFSERKKTLKGEIEDLQSLDGDIQDILIAKFQKNNLK